MKRVIFLPTAEKEYLDALTYYRESSIQSSGKFANEIKKITDRIRKFPQSSNQIVPGIRKAVLKIFPYTILYRIEQREILIVAVYHHSRHTDYWKGRIQ